MTALKLKMVDELYRHMEWADASVWTAVFACEAAKDHPKLLQCFQHLHVVQRAFLRTWRGEPRDAPYPTFEEPSRLMDWGRSFYPEAFAVLREFSDADISAPLELPWASMVERRLGRAPHGTTMGETLLQVALHSQYHRGQINSRLREVGGEPPLVDYIAWIWLGRPVADWLNVD